MKSHAPAICEPLLDTVIVRSFVVPSVLSNPGTLILVADAGAFPSAESAKAGLAAVGAIGRLCGVDHRCDVAERQALVAHDGVDVLGDPVRR